MRRVAKMRISHTAAVWQGSGPPFPGSAIPTARLTLTLTLSLTLTPKPGPWEWRTPGMGGRYRG